MDDRQFYTEKIRLDKNSRSKLITAFLEISNLIASTMGPGGRTVLINEPGRATATKDGANILKMLSFEDPYMNYAANILQDVARRTVDRVGDGTTLTTVLTANLLAQIVNSSSDENIYETLKKVRDEVAIVSSMAEAWCEKIALDNNYGLRLLKSVATISANNNEFYGNLVSDVVAQVGPWGYVSVHDSNSGKSYIERKSGYVLGGGMIHQKMMRGANVVELTNPYVLVIDQELDDFDNDIHKILTEYGQYIQNEDHRSPLVLIVQNLSGLSLSGLLNNLANFPVYVVRIPTYINRREDRYALIEDMLMVTNGKYLFSKTEGYNIRDFDSLCDADGFGAIAGRIPKVVITQDECNLIYDSDATIEANVRARIDSIDLQMKEKVGDQNLSTRKTLLECGVGTIYIDIESDTERQYVRDLLDDSIKASLSALKYGVLPGGGQFFLKAEAMYGEQFPLIREVLKIPFWKIMHNAGHTDSEIRKVVKFLESDDEAVYDALARKYTKKLSSDIWDPVDGIIQSLQNAMSAAVAASSAYMLNFNFNTNWHGRDK